MQDPVDEVRAKKMCATALQFEFSGEGLGDAAGTPARVTWHYWGLRCADSKTWMIWGEHEVEGGGSQRIGNPHGSGHTAATYDETGALIAREIKGVPGFERAQDVLPPGALFPGIASLQFTPPDAPTELKAEISLGNTLATASATRPGRPGRWVHPGVRSVGCASRPLIDHLAAQREARHGDAR